MLSCASYFGPTLKVLDLSNIRVGNEFIVALSQSLAAPALQSLFLDRADVSDASCAAWNRFSSLQHLKLLHCADAGPETLRAIARLPELCRFERTSEHPMSFEDVARIFLAPDSCPNLQYLDIGIVGYALPSSKFVPLVRSLLQVRPRPELLRFPLFSSSSLSITESSELKLIQSLCPAMDLTPLEGFIANPSMPPADILQNCKQLDLVSPLQYSEPQMKSALVSWAQKMAQLELLRLIGHAWNGIELPFQLLPSLTSLALQRIGALPANFGLLPPSLLSLTSLSVVFSDPQPPAHMDELIATIESSLTQLKELVLVAQTSWPSAHLRALVTGMPNLEKLVLKNAASDAPPGGGDTFLLSHPKLTSLDRLDTLEQCQIVPACLPSLVTLDATRLYGFEEVAARLTPVVAPNLASASFRLTRFKTSNLLSQLVVKAVSRFSATLTSLELDGVSREALLAPLVSLSRLDSLSLSGSEISDATCMSLIKSMPMLTKLTLRSCPGLTSFNWLQHSTLSDICVAECELKASTDSSGIIMELNRATCPSLRTVRLDLHESPLLKIIMSDLEDLLSFELMSPEETKIAFEATSCPSLKFMQFLSVQFSALRIKSVPMLRELAFDNCRIEDAFKTGSIDVSRPASSNVVVYRAVRGEQSLTSILGGNIIN